MRTRYVFPVWAGIPGLGAYSILEARIGSLRLLIPSSGTYGLHVLAIIGVAFGYLGSLVLVVSSPFYREAAPWRNPELSFAITLAIVAGLFALLIWEERSIFDWTIRLTSRHPRRFKQIRPIAIRPGSIFQELIAVVDDQEVSLRIEAAHTTVMTALSLARISVSPLESRRITVSLPPLDEKRTPFRSLFLRLSQTSVNIGGVAAVLFIGSLFFGYVWYLIRDPLNWVWIFATLLFGWLLVVIVRVVLRGRRFYCYKCDGFEIFFRRQGEWRCHRCGEATAL